MSEYRDTIERLRRHWQNLPPHVKERDTAKRLRDAIQVAEMRQLRITDLERAVKEHSDSVNTLRELREFDRKEITKLREKLERYE